MKLRLKWGLTLTLTFLPACGFQAETGLQKKAQRTEDAGKRVYYLLGDPMSLIEGTVANEKLPFARDEFADNPTLIYLGRIDFKQSLQVTLDRATQEEIETKNATKTTDFAHPSFIWNFTEAGAELTPVDDFELEGLVFSWIDQDYVLQTLGDVPAKLLHFSRNARNDTYSFLIDSTGDAVEKRLTWVLFAKKSTSPSEPTLLSQDFVYLGGPGVPARWRENFTINICNADRFHAGSAIQDWLPSCHGSFARENETCEFFGLQLSLGYSPTVPFSDLSASCILSTDQYLFDDPPAGNAAGIAIPIINYETLEIIAAPIMIQQQRSYYSTQSVYTHELGHLFGLGHEFRRTETGTPLHDSIMSYKDIISVQDHDRAALDALYEAAD